MPLVPYNLTIIVFYVFITIDMILTYKITGMLKKLHPKDNVQKREVNGLMRFFWKRLGLKLGSLASYIVAIVFITIALNILAPTPFFVGYLMGMYYVIFMLHIHNWQMYKGELKEAGL